MFELIVGSIQEVNERNYAVVVWALAWLFTRLIAGLIAKSISERR